MNKQSVILGVAAVLAVAALKSNAQPYAIAGNFNNWNNTGTFNPGGGPGIYTNVMTGGTAGAWEGLKIIAVSGSWNTTYPNNNLNISYDAGGSNTVYFYPGNFTDGWQPTQNRVGFEDPGNMAFEIVGDFTTPNWGSDPNGQLALKGNGVYTNTYVVPTAGSHQFSIRTPGQWGNFRCGADFSDANNGSFTTTNANQAVLIQLDLPNGRWLIGAPPVVCYTKFSVDMTLVAETDPNFIPSSVTVNGSPFGWGGTACTNDPNAANTNIYSAVIPIIANTAVEYQFRYNDGSTVYDALNGQSGVNRTLTVPSLTSTNLPVVYFNDAAPNDLLNVDTVVTFTVDMSGAVSPYLLYGTNVSFNPASDYVFLNGDFTGWLPWDPISLANYRLTETNAGSMVYSLDVTFPRGHSRSLTYKYSVNGFDNEAGYAQNHFRYIRSTNGVYALPTDTFGVQYAEPKFGNLAIGKKTGGAFPITWLGYPGVQLQDNTSLNGGGWHGNPATSGGNSTSWPASDNIHFFRLVQP